MEHMDRKEFLKALSALILGLSFTRMNSKNSYDSKMKNMKIKNWLWMHPWRRISADEYKKRFEKIKLTGIDAVAANII